MIIGILYTMSGFYANWAKVQNPDFTNNNIQMQSGGFQVPFYFGGSNVPNALNMNDNNYMGSGFNSKSRGYNFHPVGVGKSKQTTTMTGGRVHMPRQLRRV